jgi:ATP-dependent phosphofructokinase / diphosphate-dependent phosphofructokinase
MAKLKKKNHKRIGVVTGGGDCPGLNAAIRAIVKRGHQLGYEIIGIKDGWKGLIGKINARELTEEEVRGILTEGGTILGSSRTNPLKIANGMKEIAKSFKKLKLDGLITIGGDDTLGIAQKLSKNFPLIAIPKTIDNDVKGTDFCIGFWTAVQTATEALDRLHSTAESHHRVMVMEVMGRYYGWIATYAGLAGGADYILIPEVLIDIDKVCKTVKERTKKGKKFSLVVVSEGARLKGKIISKDAGGDLFGHKQLGGIGDRVAEMIREKIKIETRAVNLGHILRGGTPVAYDRILGTRLGIRAIESAAKGNFQKAAVLKGDKIALIPIFKLRGERKVNMEVYKAASFFFH